jgi:hypothetical protein
MSLCDLCNTELAPEGKPPPSGTPVLSAQAIHKAVNNGFGPCISGVKFPKTGNLVGSLATVSGLTEADTDDWWRKFVLPDTTAWVLCPTCHEATNRFIRLAVPDTRRPTLDFKGPLPGDPPLSAPLWGPGFGKTAVILSVMMQKFLLSGIQVCVCDICNFEHPRSKTHMVPAETMQREIRNGFNPWTDHRIKLRTPAAAHQVEAVYQHWRQTSLGDLTDWRLCDRCDAVINGKSPYNVVPKKWWQIW